MTGRAIIRLVVGQVWRGDDGSVRVVEQLLPDAASSRQSDQMVKVRVTLDQRGGFTRTAIQGSPAMRAWIRRANAVLEPTGAG